MYRQVLLGKQIIGATAEQITFSTGEWWKLAVPAPHWLDLIGTHVTGIRIVGDNMELTLDRTQKAFLHWRIDGRIVGPSFPIPGAPRCWDWGNEDPEWKRLDNILDEIDRAASEPEGASEPRDNQDRGNQ